MQFGLHVCTVGLPLTALGTVIESIGVRILINAQKLTANDSFEHRLQLRIIVGKLYVRPYLCTRVAQPHGMDVARIDKSVRFTVQHTEVHGGIQCIWETVLEHPGQIRILQQRFYFRNFLFDDIRLKQTLLRLGTLADVAANVIIRCRKRFFRNLFNGAGHPVTVFGCSSARHQSRQHQGSSQ